MSIFNSIMTGIFDGYFALVGMLGGQVAFWVISAVAGVVFLYIFKLTSNQKAIRKTKDSIMAGFLEVRLFKDDLGQSMKAQGRIFGGGFKYMANALKPLAFMAIPGLLILIQINLWYGFQPLKPAEDRVAFKEYFADIGIPQDVPFYKDSAAMVTVKVDGELDQAGEITLTTSEGVKIVTPALRIPAKNEVNWRVVALAEGEHTLTLKVGEKELTRTLFVGEQGKFRKIEPVRVRGALDEFFNPGHSPLPGDTPVTQFNVTYPAAEFDLLGFKMEWIYAFLILSLVFGFALKGVLGVEI